MGDKDAPNKVQKDCDTIQTEQKNIIKKKRECQNEVKKCKKGIVSAVDNVGKCKMGGGGMTCVGVANKTEAEKIVKALIPLRNELENTKLIDALTKLGLQNGKGSDGNKRSIGSRLSKLRSAMFRQERTKIEKRKERTKREKSKRTRKISQGRRKIEKRTRKKSQEEINQKIIKRKSQGRKKKGSKKEQERKRTERESQEGMEKRIPERTTRNSQEIIKTGNRKKKEKILRREIIKKKNQEKSKRNQSQGKMQEKKKGKGTRNNT